MKKILAMLVILSVCVASLLSCAKEAKEHEGNEQTDPSAYAFDAQYIRTNCCDDMEFPTYVLINSQEELNAYYEANKNSFNLERKETVFADTTIGFLDACDKYDEAYFETKNLLLIVLEEPSGSTRHQITDVRKADGKDEWVITIKRIQSQKLQTADMAAWHLFLEIQMGKGITAQDTIRIELVGD